MAAPETEPGSDSLREAAPAYGDVEARRARAGVAAALFGGLGEEDGDSEAEDASCVGRYRIDARLGAGGMGVVYSAHDPELERPVAVKLLHNDAATDDKARARMMREARSLAKLSHPNVITVYDVGTQDGQVFVAMELVQGLDLRRWLEHHRDADWREVLGLFIAAGRGLEAAHAVALIHRDFKPENVLVGDDGRVRVLDFGLARVGQHVDAATLDDQRSPSPAAAGGALGGVLGTTSPPAGALEPVEPVEPLDMPDVDLAHVATAAWAGQLTETGALVGTPLYMAPELYAGASADLRSDQFAFCASLYEGLYRQLPFGSRELRAHVRAVSTGAVVAPPEDSPVPARVWALVARGLEPEPSARHSDLATLLEQLELASKVPPPTALPEGGKVGRWIGVLALVVSLIGVLVFLELRGEGGEAGRGVPLASAATSADAALGERPSSDTEPAPTAAVEDGAPAAGSQAAETVMHEGSESESGDTGTGTEGEAATEPGHEASELEASGVQLHDWCHMHEDRYTLLLRSKARKASFVHRETCYTCRPERRRSRTRNFQPRDCAGYALCGAASAEACG